MGADFGSRMPLHIQNPALIKATGQQVNPSFESFGPHTRHKVGYKLEPETRPNTHAMSIIRRGPDGKLDFDWAKNMVLDALHNMAFPENLRPIHMALLTVVFPDKFQTMEPMQAAILTQFGDTEKTQVRKMVEAAVAEEKNWNAGLGGSVEDRHVTRNGK